MAEKTAGRPRKRPPRDQKRAKGGAGGFPALQRQSGVKPRVDRMDDGGRFHAVADVDDVESRVNEPVAFTFQRLCSHSNDNGIGFQFP